MADTHVSAPDGRPRCAWPLGDPLMLAYHDIEWGTPCHDDRALFEALVLDGAQAGLNWSTILRKREGYRAAFDEFDANLVAQYDDARVDSLLQNPAIVRNRRKVLSAINNARAYLAVQAEHGSFDAYLWRFVDGHPIENEWRELSEIPSQTPLAVTISKDLQHRGFTFVGPTICYAWIQAMGLVNDHVVSCFRWHELTGR